jgi:hypothetical protein
VADIRALPLAAQSVDDAVGWPIPAWYTQLKTTAVPILGSASAMATTIGRRSFRSVRPLTDGPLAGDNVA